MPYRFTLTTTIPATPEEVYAAWLDSVRHSQMTGGEAIMSDQIGAAVSAWDGYITGRNLELIPAERIVQSWRTSEFTDEHEDSTVTVLLAAVGNGTLLTLDHANVPDEQTSYEEHGWQSNYFDPMVVYFAARDSAAAEPAAKPVAQARAQRSGKRTAARAAKSKRAVRKTERTAKTKRAAARAKPKTSVGKAKRRGKPKAAPPAATARKPAKPRPRRTGR